MQPLSNRANSFTPTGTRVDRKIVAPKVNFDVGKAHQSARLNFWFAEVFVHQDGSQSGNCRLYREKGGKGVRQVKIGRLGQPSLAKPFGPEPECRLFDQWAGCQCREINPLIRRRGKAGRGIGPDHGRKQKITSFRRVCSQISQSQIKVMRLYIHHLSGDRKAKINFRVSGLELCKPRDQPFLRHGALGGQCDGACRCRGESPVASEIWSSAGVIYAR